MASNWQLLVECNDYQLFIWQYSALPGLTLQTQRTELNDGYHDTQDNQIYIINNPHCCRFKPGTTPSTPAVLQCCSQNILECGLQNYLHLNKVSNWYQLSAESHHARSYARSNSNIHIFKIRSVKFQRHSTVPSIKYVISTLGRELQRKNDSRGGS